MNPSLSKFFIVLLTFLSFYFAHLIETVSFYYTKEKFQCTLNTLERFFDLHHHKLFPFGAAHRFDSQKSEFETRPFGIVG